MENNLIRSFSEEFDNRKCSKKFFVFMFLLYYYQVV